MKTHSGVIDLAVLAGAGCLGVCLAALLPVFAAQTAPGGIPCGGSNIESFPATVKQRPALPSPCRTGNGVDVVTARTGQSDYVLVPVTVTPGITIRPWEAPLEVDRVDFPTLARTGRHSDTELDRTQSITGRSLADIAALARPGRLSTSGFLAEGEDIISVLKADNRLVTRLGLTHTTLATPLLHLCNLLRELYQETGARPTLTVFYGGKTLSLEVEFSRGGQKSIFNDGLDGAWTIAIRRELQESERAFLNRAYAHVEPAQRDALLKRLTALLTGEMQPFYIYRYGFYEGHTEWRTDPLVISFMFGLKSIEEIEAAFTGRLPQVLAGNAVRKPAKPAGW